MADPKKELISQNLLTTLRTILKTSGFYTDAGRSVSRRREPLTTWTGSPDVSLFLLMGPEVQDVGCLGDVHKAVARYAVLGYVRDAEPERMVCLVEADIKKAVLTDSRRGGNANSTLIADSGPLSQMAATNMDWWEIVNEKYGAVIVGFDVTYDWTVASP